MEGDHFGGADPCAGPMISAEFPQRVACKRAGAHRRPTFSWNSSWDLSTMNIQTNPQDRQGRAAAPGARRGLCHAAEGFSPRRAAGCSSNDTLWPWFERLRKEEPVHYCTNSPIEPYWSVTKYNDIMQVDTNHGIFSSDVSLGGISIRDVPPGYDWPSFIAMDQPRHDAQRKTVSPMFTPDASRRARDPDPRTRRQDPRRAAAQRDLRLGRPGLDRTDHADAGDAVRLPVRGAPQADPLVRRLDRAAEER